MKSKAVNYEENKILKNVQNSNLAVNLKPDLNQFTYYWSQLSKTVNVILCYAYYMILSHKGMNAILFFSSTSYLLVSSSEISVMFNLLLFAGFATPLLVAYIFRCKVERKKLCFSFVVVYVLGLVILTIASTIPPVIFGIIFGSYLIAAAASGCIKTCRLYKDCLLLEDKELFEKCILMFYLMAYSSSLSMFITTMFHVGFSYINNDWSTCAIGFLFVFLILNAVICFLDEHSLAFNEKEENINWKLFGYNYVKILTSFMNRIYERRKHENKLDCVCEKSSNSPGQAVKRIELNLQIERDQQLPNDSNEPVRFKMVSCNQNLHNKKPITVNDLNDLITFHQKEEQSTDKFQLKLTKNINKKVNVRIVQKKCSNVSAASDEQLNELNSDEIIGTFSLEDNSISRDVTWVNDNNDVHLSTSANKHDSDGKCHLRIEATKQGKDELENQQSINHVDFTDKLNGIQLNDNIINNHEENKDISDVKEEKGNAFCDIEIKVNDCDESKIKMRKKRNKMNISSNEIGSLIWALYILSIAGTGMIFLSVTEISEINLSIEFLAFILVMIVVNGIFLLLSYFVKLKDIKLINQLLLLQEEKKRKKNR